MGNEIDAIRKAGDELAYIVGCLRTTPIVIGDDAKWDMALDEAVGQYWDAVDAIEGA